MEIKEISKPTLPDVAFETSKDKFTPLQWVGMSGIEVPVMLSEVDGNFRLPAKVDAQVSLDRSPSRGIHMSRLYMRVQELLGENALSLGLLRQTVTDFLQSHRDLSHSARVKAHLQWPVRRAALVSSHSSWRTYPVRLSVEQEGEVAKSYIEVEITYSSTCPASAALSRQLIQQGFQQSFTTPEVSRESVESWLGTPEGIMATPHAQRSFARIKVETESLSVIDLIDLVEEALQTPVQGAVKRADEQEFARRNGQNLMFCEDAARRVREVLEQEPQVRDYTAQFEHVESLHPHSAVSFISKGIPGGLRAD